MGITLVSQSVSVDGYSAGPDVSLDHPMGVGGERLHRWLFAGDNDVDAEQARQMVSRVGAAIVGRRMFDVGVGLWQDTPYPVPTFVLTHEPREPLAMKSAAFTFVNDGVESAHKRAVAAAGGKDVVVMGGADIIGQFLRAGLVDEVHLQLMPVLLGAGTRLFADLSLELVRQASTESPHATHLRFGVARPPGYSDAENVAVGV
ncbi:dihydrofolate reductase family protein [Nonomuraea sp. NPDC050556]|uniref:dihydrofolate reductase family protein n=1 Tax=Nonomuraea sp. NPDC050556 TaxID=3364369 RepID=UPI0037BD3380